MKPHTEKVLRDLLAWDRQRITVAVQKHARLFPDYTDRQDRAEMALSQPPGSWSMEVREYWQSLVEVHGDIAAGAPRVAQALGIGLERIYKGPASVRDFGILVSIADEIGVLPVLRGAGGKAWRSA